MALGLRERKKVRTRAALQHHALLLFRQQGYEATTMSQIAEAAEVSESTLFRYFASKEALVFEDDFDEPVLQALKSQPAELGLIPAMRAAMREVFSTLSTEEQSELRLRAEMALNPTAAELRDAMAGRLLQQLAETSKLLAERLGRPPGDLRVRTLAGAFIGAMMAVTLVPVEGGPSDFLELIDAALAELETGFSS
ncbi:MAG: TetR family transcriptional regulator [Candidatus Dormibacteraeota bacterium]|nr:TetR family transcriptional regulator [Candidatus Dormibacteraeota bacterium]